jgi:polyisoprenoid-binding protein YceI
MGMRPLMIVALAPVLVAAAILPEPRKYTRDPNHSVITFQASSRLVDADGTWDNWDADITFDPDAIDKSSVAITIDAKSINTRVSMRDNDLRGKGFFFVDSFPTITFKSVTVNAPAGATKDPQMADTKLIISGDLTIRGVTKRLAIPATLVFYDRAQTMGRIKGTFTLLRKDYNVGFDPPMNPVRNEVDLRFDVTFRIPRPARGGE